MSNKIIKISIVLIFMLFVTGLFNFCFAEEVTVYPWTSEEFSNFKRNDNVISFKYLGNDYSITVDSTYNYQYYCVTYRAYNSTLNILTSDYPYSSCIWKAGYSHTLNLCTHPSFTVDKNNVASQYIQGTSLEEISFNCYHGSYSFNGTIWSRTGYSKMNSGDTYYNNSATGPSIAHDGDLVLYCDNNIKYHDSTYDYLYYNDVSPSIDMKVVQTGTKTGHVEFTKVNWDSPHMYYIKDSMDELTRLIAEEEIKVTHEKVKHYDGPIDIEYGDYVMGLLFGDDGEIVFSEISDTVTLDYDSITDNTHKLHINKEDENTYYLSIHGYQDGDYLKVSDIPNTDVLFPSKSKTLNGDSSTLEFNGLFIGQAYDTALGHKNRKVNLNKNGITYFYLYDKDNNLINSAVINSSNYYSGEEFNFDVELQFGSSLDDNLHLTSDEIRWVKVKPIIDVPSVDNYELYLRISDYGNIPYIQEEDRCIFATHDTNGSNYLGVDIGINSNTNWHRIDDKIYDYFYINTLTHDSTFTFELQLRSGSGQIIQTKSFKVNLSASSKVQGTVSSTTDGKDDTYIRNPNELSGNISTSNKYDFGGLNDLSELDLQNNVNGLIDNSVGFFSLISTFLLLLPNWISTLLYLFFFGIIVITLLRFIRGS